MKRIVIALGGNAIKQAHEDGTTEEQFSNIDKTALQIAHIVEAGYRTVITHGNGPQAGAVVIASGGGGIPVVANGDGSLSGVDAVIDKDRAGFKLAQAVEADCFMVLTDVEKACLYYNTPQQKELGRISAAETEGFLEKGHFLKGSMGPKIQAALRFVKWSGRETIITSLDKALDALDGKTGTHIVP